MAERESFYSRPGLAYYLTGLIPEAGLFSRPDRDLHRARITRIVGLVERIDWTARAGCRGVLVNLLPQGVDAARAIGERGLVVLSHPTMSGAFFGPDHGIAADVLYGVLYRVIGSDGVVYTNVGGRFNYFTLEL